MKWRWLLVATVMAVTYVGAYLWVRSQHYLVHYSGYAHGNTANHRVSTGDFWTPLASAAPYGPTVSYYLFTPLRWIETGYWYLRYPTNRPWPYFQGNNSTRPAG